jgi:hypothetical protein
MEADLLAFLARVGLLMPCLLTIEKGKDAIAS